MDYDALINLALYAEGQIVRLNKDSLTLLLMLTEFANTTAWNNAGEPLTDAEEDNLDAIVSQTFAELEGFAMLGTIFPYCTAATPVGALDCDGSTHLRTDYPALYAALDTAYIVDADHFKVPDLLGRTVIGVGHGTGLSTYAMDASGGAEGHILSTPELPNHSHAVTDTGHTHSITDHGHTHAYNAPAASNFSNVGSPGFPLRTVGASTNAATTGIAIDSATTGILVASTGSGASHENRQPYRALKYAIWAQ
jgi:microcystin-dependent protein